ncbi:PsbP-related protein [Methanobrevibacter sp.]|uniref:PsbP-related protein n=1 Tax=Methanobrevibacter sp. TaxID=66852 RepID=UPI0025F18AC8|nr:PsbP-related protein [Methanobrevibacter sp.]MBR4447543.1 zinc ribbon domain-containing protein [Methanobrevibacter sp.]
MKKCPECGNPSYDGAPICGNCGYKFPKPKIVAPKREDIFQKEPKEKKSSDNEDILSIIKENKLLIGAILLITLLVIGGIFLMGNNNSKSSSSSTPILQSSANNLLEHNESDFSFKYPTTWKQVNGSDSDHEDAIFFVNEENVTIEFYNITSDAKSLKDITQQRISHAQKQGDYVELVETITLDGRNSSNMLLENADGDYTRYVSMFSDGKLYVFKVMGSSENSITSESINSAISSADIA